MILGACKNLRVTPEYVLHELTYENLVMFGYATPIFDPDEHKKEEDWNPALDANDPDNNKEQGDGEVTDPFN